MIAMTMGDPAGIGPEIIIKALSGPSVRRISQVVVIGDRTALEQAARGLKPRPSIRSVSGPEEAARFPKNGIDVIDLKNVDMARLAIGRPTEAGGRASIEAIRAAARLALEQRVAAMVTAPISKEALNAAGYPYPGHTELLAELTGSKEAGMLMVSPGRSGKECGLRILLVTTHVAVRDLPGRLTQQRVENSLRLVHRAAVETFGLRHPRLAVTGLNPHAGEGGLFGLEEATLIRPAVEQARREGIPVTGPWPADSLIRQAYEGRYDFVVAMFHDQALIPVKLLGLGRTVNVTIGLPFIRTSVDHGTAYDIAGRGIADPGSLVEATRMAVQLTAHRTGQSKK